MSGQNTGGKAGTIRADELPAQRPAPADDAAAEALSKLGDPAAAPAQDGQPTKTPRRKSRSGTSGAERARRARGESAPASSTPRAASARKARPNIAAGMAQLYVMGGMAVSMVPSGPSAVGAGSVTQVTGQALVAHSAGIGAAWEQAAKDDPRIREALERLLAVSTFGQIVAAHLPVILTAAGAAGAVPASTLAQLGIVPATPDPAQG